MNQKIKSRGFILDLYKIFVARLRDRVMDPGRLKISVGDHDIIIDETGDMKDSKGGRGKFLFEIFSGEKG
jgi:hypothetical protein